MSKSAIHPVAWVEWSPVSVRVYRRGEGLVREGKRLSDVSDTIGVGPIGVAVSRRLSFVRTARAPDAKADAIAQALKFQVGSLFPLPADELSYGYRLTDDIGIDGRLAVLGAVRASHLRDIYAQAAALGVTVAVVTPAAYAAVAIASASSGGLIDCAVVSDGPDGLGIDLVVGRELRYSRLSAMPKDEGAVDVEVMRAFAAAGTGCLPTIAAGRNLPMVQGEVQTRTTPMEALAASDGPVIAIELADLAEARIRREGASQLRGAVLALAIAVALFTFVWFQRTGLVAKAKSADSKRASALAALKAKRDGGIGDVAAAADTYAVLERAFVPAQPAVDVVDLVSSEAPIGVWLTGITVERGKPLQVRGTALKGVTVADYLIKLSAEPRLRDVSLVFASNATIDTTPVVQFSLSATIVGNVPLIDDLRKGAK